ncbi:lipoxygenase family protein [Enhygromyxa salina]|nr:lipoxygenase family protein [Enhygromyxa salina]
MTNPSLPQHDDPEQQAERARDLAWAQTQYTWAHSHTYDVGDGKQLVLEPIAVLNVDDDHPLPSSQKLSLVQLLDLITTGLDLVGNIVVSLTNLVDVGSVEFDGPPPDSFSASGEKKPRVILERKGEKIAGKLRGAADRVAEKVEDAVEDAVEDVKAVEDDALDVADVADAIKELVAKLEDQREAGEKLLSKAHRAALAKGQVKRELVDDLTASLGDMIKGVLEALFEDLAEAVLTAAGLWGQAQAIGDFARQFQTLVVPNVVSTTMTDACFARMRIAGPNALVIAKIEALPTGFPVDAARFEALTGQTLDAALASGRVYLTDYAALADVIGGVEPAGHKYISAAFALFVLGEDRQSLSPVAIQCSQEPGNSSPIFYADDGETWELAKLHVQSADGNYHELISHLGLTHLLIEPFAVASHRHLAQQHPVYVLLLPHFQGTLFINSSAITSLINPGGVVDQLLAGTIESDWSVVSTALTSLDFNAHMLPNDLEARGVADPKLFPNYPYRDDALLVWAAIEAWVRDYLSIYYNNDDDVVGDPELQAWYQDLVSPDGGCVQGLGERRADGSVGLFTFDYLTKVLTMVIFTGSAQHASVNFPQRGIMSYTPAMPLAAYAPAPTQVSGSLPPDTELAHLPPLQMALLQQLVGQLLGGIYFTRLGEYDRHQRQPWFSDPRVAEPLAAFQTTLVSVENTIGARNRERPVYQALLPSRIPQSINI